MTHPFKMPMKASHIILFVAACLCVCVPVHAQDKNAAKPPVFGNVELPKVFAEYKKQGPAQDFAAEQTVYNGVLERLVSGSARFLSEAEIRGLAALYEKPKQTDEEKKRIGALQEKGDTAAAKYKLLEQTGNPTAAQTQEYTQLEDTQKRGTQVMDGIRNGYAQKLDARRQEVEAKILADIKAAIGKVATERGISIVFTSDVAIWTANDVTADVIKLVNKG